MSVTTTSFQAYAESGGCASKKVFNYVESFHRGLRCGYGGIHDADEGAAEQAIGLLLSVTRHIGEAQRMAETYVCVMIVAIYCFQSKNHKYNTYATN